MFFLHFRILGLFTRFSITVLYQREQRFCLKAIQPFFSLWFQKLALKKKLNVKFPKRKIWRWTGAGKMFLHFRTWLDLKIYSIVANYMGGMANSPLHKQIYRLVSLNLFFAFMWKKHSCWIIAHSCWLGILSNSGNILERKTTFV